MISILFLINDLIIIHISYKLKIDRKKTNVY